MINTTNSTTYFDANRTIRKYSMNKTINIQLGGVIYDLANYIEDDDTANLIENVKTPVDVKGENMVYTVMKTSGEEGYCNLLVIVIWVLSVFQIWK